MAVDALGNICYTCHELLAVCFLLQSYSLMKQPHVTCNTAQTSTHKQVSRTGTIQQSIQQPNSTTAFILPKAVEAARL